MTKKKQTSLASFFAGGKGNGGNKASSKPKSKSKPTTNNTNDNAATSSRDETKKDLKRKETMTPLKDMDEEESKEKTNMLVDTDDEGKEVDEEQQNNDSSPTTEKESTRSERRSKKAKLVIDDDDDDEIEKDHEIDEEEEEEEEQEHDDNNYDEDIETEDMMDDEEDADDDDEEEDDDDDVGKEEEVKKEADDEDDEKMPLTSLSKAFSKSKTNSKKNSKPKKNIKNVSALSSSSSTTTTTTITNTTFKEWKENTPVSYSTLTETLSSIEAITGRLEIQNHLTQLFNECIRKYPTDLITIVYLASNSVAPAYDCVELGIGDAILIKAVAEASGSTPTMIKQKYESHGDLGSVAMNAKGKQRTLGFGRKPKPLDANEVLNVYRQIAAISGSQSQKMKVDLIKGLLVRATQKGNESKYIIRGLQGKLRIGLAQSTVLISLAHAVLANPVSTDGEEDKDDESEEELPLDCQNVKNLKLPKETRVESAISIVKKAYSEVSSYDALVEALVTKPLWQLHKFCTLRPGNPVTPMLAKPTKSILEVLKRLNGKRFTCEYKYDGERAQVHMKDDGVTKVFSRSLLDTSEKFPEVPLYVKEACVDTVQSFILDTEVVAYNRETKQFVPFQVLSTRKKTEESDDNAKVKVIVQAFDLMYLNGQSLLDHTLAERRDLLLKNFNVVDGKFQFATALDHKEDGDTTLIEDFLDAAVKGQCEGLMVKTLDDNASYQPSLRSLNWLKLKKDYLEGMGDSLDLVPVGAYHGRGKRTGVYGAYLLACYDLDTEEFQSVCKIGTGFSDEDLKSLSAGLKSKIITEKTSQYNVSSSLECDVWFEACQVWEVKAADLSKSSTHKGAIDKTGESGRGIGLRFPRFERLRDDKKPEDATTSDQILEMYYAQDSIVNDGTADYGDDGI